MRAISQFLLLVSLLAWGCSNDEALRASIEKDLNGSLSVGDSNSKIEEILSARKYPFSFDDFARRYQATENVHVTPELFIAAYEDALASQNWDIVAPLIHDDCVATFSSGTYKGKKEVEGIFRRNFASIRDEHYAITNIHWVRRAEDFAVFTFDFRWSGIISGKEASGGGRGTSVIVKSAAGWQLISEHLGPARPKQP